MPIRKLRPAILDKVWGSPLTKPWLENPDHRKVGEIWYSDPKSMPVLVKLLFTSDKLSVQVHPDDAYAQAHGAVRGKTEMWHVLRAEPGALVALGLREPATKEAVRAGALDGAIVDMLQWLPAAAGDTFFVPAGTIHAIGGGLVICEIQEWSDVTYRLFDYQRKPVRPLHLDDSLAVANLDAVSRRMLPVRIDADRELLAECQHFRTERLTVRGSAICPAITRPAMYIAIAGEGKIDGDPFSQGEAWLAPPDTESLTIESPEAAFIVASTTSTGS